MEGCTPEISAEQYDTNIALLLSASESLLLTQQDEILDRIREQNGTSGAGSQDEQNKSYQHDQQDQTQTHYYDGNLKSELILIRFFLDAINNTECEQIKKDVVDKFVREILQFDLKEKDDTSIDCLYTIIAQWGTNNNYDPTNEIRAEDMLYICALEFASMVTLNGTTENPYENIKEYPLLQDFCRELFIQLSDVQSGPCAQGRATRLWQIVYGYYEYFYGSYSSTCNNTSITL
jgi:hypothetical protein